MLNANKEDKNIFLYKSDKKANGKMHFTES